MTDQQIAAILSFRDALKQAVSAYNGVGSALGGERDSAGRAVQSLAELVAGIAAQLDNVVLEQATDFDAPAPLIDPAAETAAKQALANAADDPDTVTAAEPAPVQQPTPGADPVPAADQPVPAQPDTKVGDVAETVPPAPEQDGAAPPSVLIPDPPADKAVAAEQAAVDPPKA